MLARAFLLAFLVIAAVPALAQERPSREEWEAGQADAAAAKGAAAAKQSKMAAVDKVITMLEDLQTSVAKEGEDESWTYNKFACFCKDTTGEKSDAITAGEAKSAGLSAFIENRAADRDGLDEKIAGLIADIKEAQEAMEKAAAKRKGELALYTKNAEDLSGALDALRAAIASLKGSRSASFLQLNTMAKTVQKALAMADALGLAGATKASRAVTALLQQNPDVPMQDYDFHSDGIIETLEKLLADFTAEKNQIDAAEVQSVKEHDSFMQDRTDFIKDSTAALEAAKKAKAEAMEDIATASQELSTTAAVLLDDKEYLTELTKMCHERAVTYDQRVECRSGELSALTAAIGILRGTVSEKTSAATVRLNQQKVDIRFASVIARDEPSMEAIEAEAEAADGQDSFLQVAAQPRRLLSALAQQRAASPSLSAQQAVADLLGAQGKKIKSTLLVRLASQIASDPFAKVKKLIQELIERLLQEAANEANQKGWCDKATADAEQKRDYAVEEVTSLNSEMAELEARRDTLRDEIADLKAARAKATKLREAESAENAATVEEAHAGLEAINQAIDIMEKFYKTAAKNTVLAQQKGPADDAPDAGFKAGEAYKGAQGASTGIIGMMDVIKTDFERTISETEKAEAEAQQAHLEFMTETGKSLAAKTQAKEEKNTQLDDALEKLANASDQLDEQTAILQESINELRELKPACVDTGMSYEERVARREEEIEALKKADCILVHFSEYGPEGAAEAC